MDTSKTYSVKSNAVRDAKKVLVGGDAPGDTFRVKAVDGGGFRIEWLPPPTVATGAPVAAETDVGTGTSPESEEPHDSAPVATTTRRSATPRADSKQAQVTAMLRRPEGASLREIMGVTGWQAHTTRGFIAGTAKKKLGLAITSTKDGERGLVYRAAA